MSTNAVSAPRLCRVPEVFRTWFHQVGAKMEGFRLPLQWRGMRTTLVNDALNRNEVETFPRHHEQRRVTNRVPRARRDGQEECAAESSMRFSASRRALVSLSTRA